MRLAQISLVGCVRSTTPRDYLIKPPKQYGGHFLESPLLAGSPGQKGTYRMYALNFKVVIFILCALAAAVVIHSIVYLSIDPASLSAEMPAR
jgi:hypothetical protein